MLCTHCAEIDLNNNSNGYQYTLLDSQQMSKSADAGCEGCRIFLRLLMDHFKRPPNESDPALPAVRVQLRRYGPKKSRVDLEFVEGGEAPAVRGTVGLRLCSAYGM